MEAADRALCSLEGNWLADEKSYYQGEHEAEDGPPVDPASIPTSELKDGNYKDLRTLRDFVDAMKAKEDEAAPWINHPNHPLASAFREAYPLDGKGQFFGAGQHAEGGGASLWMLLKDTPFSRGTQEIEGWNSKDLHDRARGTYVYEPEGDPVKVCTQCDKAFDTQTEVLDSVILSALWEELRDHWGWTQPLFLCADCLQVRHKADCEPKGSSDSE
jgi:hypothetical protein